EYREQKKALKELKKEHEGYADALRDSKDAAEKEGQEKIAQAQNNRRLLDSLADMIDENGKCKGSAEEAQFAVSQLNDSIDGLGLAVDETTGQFNMSGQALEEYGKILEAVARHEAAQGEYNNILKE